MSQQITILGCGPVGLTFANCLVRSPFVRSITLIDRKLPKPERFLPPIPNQRVYSINQPSLNLYRNLNILPTIRKYGIMNKIQVLSKESEEFVQW
jgi:2-polyprenyl-6-methoxyphenol hydroxylase-like FAD-dependent oxidoreductase